MEGTIFYFVCWSCWIYLTFIMDKKNKYRLKLSAIILIVILLSNIHFTLKGLEIYASGLFLLLMSYLSLSQEKSRTILYSLICSLIISIAYVSFYLFEIFDPIWIFFDKQWMMAIIFSYLAILLQKDVKGRLLIIISGTMQGEFLLALTVSTFPFPYSIGTFEYLDVSFLMMAIVVCWSMLQQTGTYLQQHLHFFEKGRQKSS